MICGFAFCLRTHRTQRTDSATHTHTWTCTHTHTKHTYLQSYTPPHTHTHTHTHTLNFKIKCNSFQSWMLSVLGPSLPDIQFILGIDLSKASWIFTCQAQGFGVGCALHGLLYDRLHILVLMATYSFLAGLMWIATPWCNLFWMMLVIRVVGGIFTGCMDACELSRS